MKPRKLRIDPEKLAALPEAERTALTAHLAELEATLKANPLWAYNHPLLSREIHDKQLEFHAPGPRTRLFIGGNRSGKTTATHLDTILQAVDRDVVPEHLQRFKKWEPPFYCRIIGPDLTRWLEGVSLQKMREWLPKGQLFGGSFARGWDKKQVMLRFANGSTIQFMSNDQDLDVFTGTALHRTVYDEPPRYDIWRECRMRLIDYGGDELFGLTPLDGFSNWLYEEFYVPWERGDLDPSVRLVLVDMDDNPHLSDEDKEWALSGLSQEERDARKTGRFVTFSGLIYPEWAPGLHVIPQIDELPYGVEVFVGIDPGYRHMCAVLFAYLDYDNEMVIFDEIAAEKTLISEVCKEIKIRCRRWDIKPNWYVIDPAARNKNGQTGRSDQQEFADNGIFTIPGQNAVGAGINRVKERLAHHKLRVAANCPELISEFKKYRWAKESNRTENDAPEKPVKRDDHALDVLRYLVMQRPLAPRENRPRPNESMKDRMLRLDLKRLRTRGSGRVIDHPQGDGIYR